MGGGNVGDRVGHRRLDMLGDPRPIDFVQDRMDDNQLVRGDHRGRRAYMA